VITTSIRELLEKTNPASPIQTHVRKVILTMGASSGIGESTASYLDRDAGVGIVGA
jgi:NADP-dependent 3-hydroxy acid dehydrogenase YdfG